MEKTQVTVAVIPVRYSYPEQCEGPVDAAGLPASEALRCSGVVEQSDPETRHPGRQRRPAVSAHRFPAVLLHCLKNTPEGAVV